MVRHTILYLSPVQHFSRETVQFSNIQARSYPVQLSPWWNMSRPLCSLKNISAVSISRKDINSPLSTHSTSMGYRRGNLNAHLVYGTTCSRRRINTSLFHTFQESLVEIYRTQRLEGMVGLSGTQTKDFDSGCTRQARSYQTALPGGAAIYCLKNFLLRSMLSGSFTLFLLNKHIDNNHQDTGDIKQKDDFQDNNRRKIRANLKWVRMALTMRFSS